MAVPKVVVVVAARLNSERFPEKVLYEFDGHFLVSRVISQAQRSGYPVVLSTPERDTRLIDVVRRNSRFARVQVTEGPENDLIRRHLLASEGYEHVVRVTGDCPFLDPWAARCTINTHLEGGYDLTIDEAEGRGVQVYTRRLLEVMDKATDNPYECEHLDVWPLRSGYVNIHRMKFSVDTPAELGLARRRITL